METNKEHYAKEIVEIGLSGSRVTLVNNEPVCCNEENCYDCELDGKDGCDLDKLRKWGNQEYHEPVPKLTELEIEELTYFSHHGVYDIYFSHYSDSWEIGFTDNEKVTNSAVLLCEYSTLDDKVYKIKDLLEGQNVK